MKTEGAGQLLRIFVGETNRWEGRPLYEAIVRAGRDHGLAGATAFRGIEGFGVSGRIYSVKVLHLSENLPVVIEIIDRVERIQSFLPILDTMITEGLVTIENVNFSVYRRDDEVAADGDEIQLDTSDFEPAAPAPITPTGDSAQQTIQLAKKQAAASRRVYVDSIDILSAMLHDTESMAARVLGDLGLDARTVVRSLREAVNRDETSAAYLAALEEKSYTEAKWLKDDCVGTEHLLLALCEVRPSAATDILMRLGAQPRDVCRGVLKALDRDEDWQRWLADHPEM